MQFFANYNIVSYLKDIYYKFEPGAVSENVLWRHKSDDESETNAA